MPIQFHKTKENTLKDPSKWYEKKQLKTVGSVTHLSSDPIHVLWATQIQILYRFINIHSGELNIENIQRKLQTKFCGIQKVEEIIFMWR